MSRPCFCDVDTRSCLRHNRAYEIAPGLHLSVAHSFECLQLTTRAFSSGDKHACGLGYLDRFSQPDGNCCGHGHLDTTANADVHADAAT